MEHENERAVHSTGRSIRKGMRHIALVGSGRLSHFLADC